MERNPSPEAESESQQGFLDSLGDIPSYEKSHFKGCINHTFSVLGCAGKMGIKIKLDEIVELKENSVKWRENVRQFPFILEFTAVDSPLLPDGMYQITNDKESADRFVLYIKALDHIEEKNLMIYESVIN